MLIKCFTHYLYDQALAIQYIMHNKVKPKRVVVYRNGSSEGNFDQVIASEVGSLRKAFQELLGTCASHVGNERSCSNNCGDGCTFCTPIITYIVALSQHNIRVVPAKPEHTRKNNLLNVPSGTCVDHTITSYMDGQNMAVEWPTAPSRDPDVRIFEQRESSGFDFLLTAQGGLKGTSKPIFYRVVSCH